MICEYCKKEYVGERKERRFCGRSCAATFGAIGKRKWNTEEEQRLHKNALIRGWYQRNKPAARAKKAAQMRAAREKNPHAFRERARVRKAKTRAALLAFYGDKCARCGFTDRRALTLDHVLNNGSEERRKMSQPGIYRRALMVEFRAEYQTLCMNCQFIKRVESANPTA